MTDKRPGNRSRGTVPTFAAERGFLVDNALSPRKWDCPLRPVRGQVHVFGHRVLRKMAVFCRKMDQSPSGPCALRFAHDMGMKPWSPSGSSRRLCDRPATSPPLRAGSRPVRVTCSIARTMLARRGASGNTSGSSGRVRAGPAPAWPGRGGPRHGPRNRRWSATCGRF